MEQCGHLAQLQLHQVEWGKEDGPKLDVQNTSPSMGDGERKRARAEGAHQTRNHAGTVPPRSSLTRLNELAPSQAHVDIVALVRVILPQGQVTCRNGALVSLCVVKLADESDTAGSVSLKLWRQRAEWASEHLRVGEILLLTNAVVSQWRDAPVEVSLREYEGSRLRVFPCPADDDLTASKALLSELQAQRGVAERTRAVMTWAVSLRGTPSAAVVTRARSVSTEAGKDKNVGNDSANHPQLLTFGSREPPVSCGNVCGGACEWVRSRQAGATGTSRGNNARASQHGIGIGDNGFKGLARLLDGSHEGQGRVRVCGLLMLAREGVTACSALLSGQKISRIPALISCGNLDHHQQQQQQQQQQQHSIARTSVPMFCRVEIFGKHCKPLALFFHQLRIRSPASVWSDQCAAQVQADPKRGLVRPDLPFSPMMPMLRMHAQVPMRTPIPSAHMQR